MLAWTFYTSFIGVAVLMSLKPDQKKAARVVALMTALIGLSIALAGAVQYKLGSGIVVIKKIAWIPSLGINYHLAADGISLTLVVLTGFAAVAGILFSWNVESRVKE